MRQAPWQWHTPVGLCLLLAACSGSDGSQQVVAPEEPAPPEPPTRKTITLSGPDGLPPTPAAGDAGPPGWEPGRIVRARGRKSNHPRLRLMASVPGKLAEYLDLEDGGQTVLYVEEFPHCRGLMEAEGTVMEVLGPRQAPRPSSDGTAVEQQERYSELHIDVLRYRCLE